MPCIAEPPLPRWRVHATGCSAPIAFDLNREPWSVCSPRLPGGSLHMCSDLAWRSRRGQAKQPRSLQPSEASDRARFSLRRSRTAGGTELSIRSAIIGFQVITNALRTPTSLGRASAGGENRSAARGKKLDGKAKSRRALLSSLGGRRGKKPAVLREPSTETFPPSRSPPAHARTLRSCLGSRSFPFFFRSQAL